MSNGLTAPVLSQVQWIGTTTIQANFTFSSGSTFQIGLFQGTNETPTQTAAATPGVAMLSNPQVDTTSVWTIRIAQTSGSTVGPYSNAIPVIVGPPLNITVANDGNALALTWAPPAGATVADGASVLLLNAATGVIIDNITAEGTAAVYRPPGGINPAISYSVKLAGSLNTSFGPYSSAIAVVQGTPQFSGITYSLAGNGASITANAQTGTNFLALSIFAQGVMVASAVSPTAGSFVQLSLPQALDPAFQYDAFLAYTVSGGATRGPLSTPQTLITLPVTIGAVSYDGTSVTVSWDNGVGTPPPTGGFVQILNSAGGAVAWTSPYGTNVTWAPSPALAANTPYTVKINPTRSLSTGPVSASVDVLTFTETLSSVSYDGSNIAASWTRAGSPDVERTIVALLNGGAVVQTQPGGSTSTAIAAALAPAGTYDLALQTAGADTLGPLGPSLPVISAVPRVTGAVYTITGVTSSLAVTWDVSQTSGAHGVTGYSVQLYENGAPLGSAVTVSGAGTATKTLSLQSVLDPSKTHTITVQATGTNTAGPLSTASPAITAAPVLASVAYDSGNVTASWQPVLQAGVSGYSVTVGGTTKTTSATSITVPYSASGPSPTITVTAVGATATGPAASETMLTETVSVTSTSYDGASLTVAWQTSSPSPSYVVQVLDEGGSVVASQASPGVQATLAVALSPAETYTVVVRASGPGVLGPAGTAFAILSAVPSFAGIVTGTSIVATLNAPAVTANVSGYQAALFVGDTQLGSWVNASGMSVTLPLPSPLVPSGYSVRARAIGTNLTGPMTSAAAVVVSAPAILSIDFDGANASVAWTPVEGASGYELVASASPTTPHYTSGTSLTFPILSTADTLTVSAISGVATGPASGAASVIVETVAPSSVGYDGSFLTLAWTAAQTNGATYLVELLNNGAVETTFPASGTSGQFPAALSASGTYTVRLRVVSGISTGGPGTSMAAISAVPSFAEIVTGTSIVATLNAPAVTANISGYQAALFVGDALVGSWVNASGMTVTLPLPSPLVPSGYSVRARATGTNLTGPMTSAISVVVSAPEILSIDFDGANASVAWTPVEGASGYEIVASASPTTPHYTSGTSLTFPILSTADTLTVSAISGVATGPASGAASVVVETVAPSSAGYDGSFLTLAWPAAQTNGATYLAELLNNGLNNGAVETTFAASGTSGQFPAALSASGAYTVRLRVVSDISTGGPGTSMAAISAVPSFAEIVTGTSIAVTLNAPVVTANISGYQAALFIGDALVGSWVNASGMIATLPLPSPLVPSGYSVRARATGTNLTGPMTSPTPVVVAAPEILSIDFDGANASIAWTPVEGASGYELVASASPATPHYTSGTSLTFPILSAADTLTVSAISGVATGPASGAASVIVETVAPTQASYDGSFLTLTWPAAQTNGATYVVELLNNGSIDTAFDASGTSGQFPAALSPSGTYTARIRVVSGVSAGAPGTALAAISASPSIAAIVASATALTVTLTAPQPVSGIGGYEAALFSGPELIGSWVPATGTTVTLPIASPANPWQYTVQARATAANATGPAVSADAITVAPENLEATYDGENVLAAWDAVTVPSVVGYRVTLASGATVLTSLDTASTSISIPWALALATNDYFVTVQAIGDVATGPPSESANPVADSVGYFFPPGLVSPSAPADYAYVFRGDIRQPGPSSEITLYLPDIFKAPLAAPIHAAPFTIEAAPGGSGMPYQLVAGGGSPPDIWTFTTNGIRTDIAAAAASVFSQAAPLAAPGGLALLQQVFAQGLPLNFAETLFYAYGLNGQAGYVNLQPGMRLRIDYENYQLVSNSPTDKLNGYSGSGTSTYDIVSLPTNGAYLPVAFDAFLSQLSVPSVAANTGGDGGIIDLQGSAYALQFFRLFYPPNFPSADSAGVIGASQNAVILGASTYTALQAATTQYLSFNNFNGVTGIVWTYFRGRATLIPELEVFVNGVPVWVSLGTTAGQLLQRTSALPYAENTSAARFLYRRAIGNVVDAASEVLPSYAIGRSNVVNFGYGTVGQYTGGLGPFDLPVLSGDSLTFES